MSNFKLNYLCAQKKRQQVCSRYYIVSSYIPSRASCVYPSKTAEALMQMNYEKTTRVLITALPLPSLNNARFCLQLR